MSNLPFEDDPFNDDPFRDIPNASDSSSGLPPRGSGNIGNIGIGNARPVTDLSTIGGPPQEDVTQDYPADLLIPPPIRQRNTVFILGLGLLAVVVVVGLAVILYAALQNGVINKNYQETVVAVVATNNAVNTSVAASATAKSWTATPSNTPLPTITLTPSLTITPSPTITLTSSLTVTPSPTNTFAPSVTPPTATLTLAPPTVTLPPTLVPAVAQPNVVDPQIARLQAALQILQLQQTAIAVLPKSNQRQTESAQIGAALTAIGIELGPNAANPGLGNGLIAIGSPTATSTPTSSPTLPELFPPTSTLTAQPPAGLNVNAAQQPVMALRQQIVPLASATPGVLALPTKNAVQSLGTAVSPQAPLATPNRTALAITATGQALLNNEGQLNNVQTAISVQLTVNAQTPTSLAGNTANSQLELGLTAVAYQLGQDQAAFNKLMNLSAFPRTGLYDDLANGRATPASLALLGIAGIGLIAVIVISRRLRVRLK